MVGPLERLLRRFPRHRSRIRELVETDEIFASLTREYDAAADEEDRSGPGAVPRANTKAEKSRRRKGAIELDIVARLESSARIL